MNAQDELIKYAASKIQAALKTYLTGTYTQSFDSLLGLGKTQESKKKPQLSHSKNKPEAETQQVSFPQPIFHSCLGIK